VYNRLASEFGGQRVQHEHRERPGWLPLSFSAAGGSWLGEPGAMISGEELRLDMAAGCWSAGSG
jgi:hypothetical protein